MQQVRPAVIALGGSVLKEADQRQEWLDLMVKGLLERARKIPMALVIGGGELARQAISLARVGTSDSDLLDEIGIGGTRLNALIFSTWLKNDRIEVSSTIPHSIEKAATLIQKNRIVVMGGTYPGHTTDAVAIRLASLIHARRCIIATNVSHVYNEDPRENNDAQPIEALSHTELRQICGDPGQHVPGGQGVVDAVGAAAAAEAGLELRILDGRDHTRLLNALDGQDFEGTLVTEG